MVESVTEHHDARTERRQLFGTFGYLVGSQGSTAVLGLAYWAFVTHFFQAPQVGLAFAATSTATLLATVGILGIATFLIAEMGSMERHIQRSVLSTSLVVACAAVGLLGVGTLLLSSSLGNSLAAIGSDPVMAFLFFAGAVATVAAVTFDNAAIGIHRGEAQLWRGILASLLKFLCVAVLIVAGIRTGSGLILAWAVGLAVSLVVCYPMLRLERTPPGGATVRARMAITRRFGPLSLNHHVLNLSINSVSYFVPVVAALLIDARQYAYFATAQTLASVVLIVPYLLTLALFAETSNDERRLHRHVRRTLPLGMVAASGIVGMVALAAPVVLRLFGAVYATHGTTSLRILVLAGPSYVVKDHYVAIRRTQGRLGLASRVLAAGTVAEVLGAVVGGAAAGLMGLCTGWVIVAALEAVLLSPTVLRVFRGEASDGARRRSSPPATGSPVTGPGPRVERAGRRPVVAAVPRADRRVPCRADLDPDLPALVFRIPGYPLHHGGVGAVRTLGRAGVPVYAVVEDRATPAAVSRYLRGAIVSRPAQAESPTRLVERLVDFSDELGTAPLLVCTDDAAAVVVAEHAAVLGRHFVLPDVPAGLPRRLADKHWLFHFCRENGVPAPVTRLVDTADDLESAVGAMTLPVVVKSTALRDSAFVQTARHGAVVRSRAELGSLHRGWDEPYRVVVQEYLPDEACEDWIVHGYCGADAELTVAFTGRKVRSWPPRAGATARAFVDTNDALLELTARLCRRLGYRGVFDLDWRLDRRTGRYNLLDFNPRLGAQFRMFENDAGVDVVRAMHLDLSGRAVPAGEARQGERFVVEPFDLASRWAERRRRPRSPGDPARRGGSGRPRLAWWAVDDPLPAAVMVGRQVGQSLLARVRARPSPGTGAPAGVAGPGAPVLSTAPGAPVPPAGDEGAQRDAETILR